MYYVSDFSAGYEPNACGGLGVVCPSGTVLDLLNLHEHCWTPGIKHKQNDKVLKVIYR